MKKSYPPRHASGLLDAVGDQEHRIHKKGRAQQNKPRAMASSTLHPGKRSAPSRIPMGTPRTRARIELVRHTFAAVERIFKSSASAERIYSIAFRIEERIKHNPSKIAVEKNSTAVILLHKARGINPSRHRWRQRCLGRGLLHRGGGLCLCRGFGGSRRSALSTGRQSKNHDQCKNQGYDLFHFVFPPKKYPLPRTKQTQMICAAFCSRKEARPPLARKAYSVVRSVAPIDC